MHIPEIGLQNADMYISPHRDDVCFALGGLLSSLPRDNARYLVNVFTRSVFAPNAPIGPSVFKTQLEVADYVTELRKMEDAAFAEQCGLHRIELNYSEPRLRNRLPFTELQSTDVDLFESHLLRILQANRINKNATTSKPYLYIPLGVGNHIDHVAICVFAIRHFDILSKLYRVRLYEEIPYCWKQGSTERALQRVSGVYRGYNASNSTLQLSPEQAERKMELMGFYRSQCSIFAEFDHQYALNRIAMQPYERWWDVSK